MKQLFALLTKVYEKKSSCEYTMHTEGKMLNPKLRNHSSMKILTNYVLKVRYRVHAPKTSIL